MPQRLPATSYPWRSELAGLKVVKRKNLQATQARFGKLPCRQEAAGVLAGGVCFAS
jgi:hypothetical protein